MNFLISFDTFELKLVRSDAWCPNTTATPRTAAGLRHGEVRAAPKTAARMLSVSEGLLGESPRTRNGQSADSSDQHAARLQRAATGQIR